MGMSSSAFLQESYAGIERRRHTRPESIQWLGQRPVERQVIMESSKNQIEFNVMPGRSVREVLQIKEYKIAPRYIEARFDREYFSSMENSPSHLIFLTALVHMQKMAYVYFVHELGLPYDPNAKELIKFWPIEFDINLPKLLQEEKDIIHRMWITQVIEKGSDRVIFDTVSLVNDILTFNVRSLLIRGCESPNQAKRSGK
jgi:hypothetical protein